MRVQFFHLARTRRVGGSARKALEASAGTPSWRTCMGESTHALSWHFETKVQEEGPLDLAEPRSRGLLAEGPSKIRRFLDTPNYHF